MYPAMSQFMRDEDVILPYLAGQTSVYGICAGIFCLLDAIRGRDYCKSMKLVLSSNWSTRKNGKRLHPLAVNILIYQAGKSSC